MINHSIASHLHSSPERKNMYWLCKMKPSFTLMSITIACGSHVTSSQSERREMDEQSTSLTSFQRRLDGLNCRRNRLHSSSSVQLSPVSLHLKCERLFTLERVSMR